MTRQHVTGFIAGVVFVYVFHRVTGATSSKAKGA